MNALKALLKKLRGAASKVKQKVAIDEPICLPAPVVSYSGPISLRWRAIRRALFFGLIPWWVYEDEKHHKGGWRHHAGINVNLAMRWLRGRETDEDREFERQVNA